MERVGSKSLDGPDECQIEHGCDSISLLAVILRAALVSDRERVATVNPEELKKRKG